MEFETFRGRDVAEVMAAVKAAYGANAWIGRTRHMSNGRLGSLEQRIVEVKAAPLLPGSEESVGLRPNPKLELLGALAEKRRTSLCSKPEVPKERQPTSGGNDMGVSLAAQLESIRVMLEELHAARTPKERVAGALDAARLEGSLAARLSRGATAAARKGDGALQAWLRSRLGREISIRPDPLVQPGRRIVMCVGPTGAGKTTTIAKLAARAQFELGKEILLLTMDTYRVGSIAQIERFASLMGAPFAVASEVSQFCDAMMKYPAEVVFIDTASLPPSDSESSRRVTDILAAAPGVPVETLLVLPAMMRGRDAEHVARMYRTPKPTGLVITKLDEIDRAGGVLHACINAELPVAYLSSGPRVPEDIEPATVDGVLQGVFPEFS